MTETVVGLYDSFADAQAAVQGLVNSGIPRENISVLANRESAGLTGDETFEEGKDYTPVTDGAAKGAKTGSVLGGLTGFLVGMGFLAIPGVGPILAAGPLLATLAGAGVGAAAGGLLGALTNAGVPKEQAEYYAEGLRRGGTLVLVHTDATQAAAVANVLNEYGPINIEERGGHYRETGYAGHDETLAPYTTDQISTEQARFAPATSTAVADGTVIPVVEESLQVGKRTVESGGARIHTRIIETPVEESVTLREEHVTVTRRPVDRAATDADFATGAVDATLTESREVPVIAKEARVVEEVRVGKTVEDHTETVSDTVRKTVVTVDAVDGAGKAA